MQNMSFENYMLFMAYKSCLLYNDMIRLKIPTFDI
jgi:hypothetical protein